MLVIRKVEETTDNLHDNIKGFNDALGFIEDYINRLELNYDDSIYELKGAIDKSEYLPEVEGFDLDKVTQSILSTLMDGGKIKSEYLPEVEGFDLDKVYPVGSIYISLNYDFNPNTAFGGNWDKLPDDYYLTSTTTSYVGQTVGKNYHTLTFDEMPSHNHTQDSHSHDMSGQVWSDGAGGGAAYVQQSKRKTVKRRTSTETPTINYAGGGQSFSIRPQSKIVVMWKRNS